MDGLENPYRRLAMFIIYRAVSDVRKSNVHADDALKFLRGAWCRHLAELLSIEQERLGDLVRALSQTMSRRLPLNSDNWVQLVLTGHKWC